ncbi:MAG: hypothetical protein ABSG03_24875 [Bryobacteraceae bacterium]
MIEIDGCVFRPQRAPEFLARDDLSLLLQQCNQQQKRLPLQPDFGAFFPEFARSKIDFKNAEADRAHG